MTDYKFEGWLGEDESSVKGNMKWGGFEPKKWEEDDVDIQISHCGVCGSDLHTLSSGWGPTPYRELQTAHFSSSHANTRLQLALLATRSWATPSKWAPT